MLVHATEFTGARTCMALCLGCKHTQCWTTTTTCTHTPAPLTHERHARCSCLDGLVADCKDTQYAPGCLLFCSNYYGYFPGMC